MSEAAMASGPTPGPAAGAGDWYRAADVPEVVEFGPVSGLAVTGQGEPGGVVYGECLGALYAVAGALAGRAGFALPPLEGRWWAEDSRPALEVPRELWRWHLFLRMPDGLAAGAADGAREEARGSGAAVDRVQWVTFAEGRCVQMTHRGSFAEEHRSLALMDAAMRDLGLVPNGLHHEIYLSGVDPRADPAALRTILRQPVRPA
ncbi:GyrI-like domain-containing protein [Bailinhaonella thermotolerans]|uniref:Uncharacterized protein n=1 Tax=Bailinhaonella thermotolerans TaxID=1070861 RepID=A0A3A4BUP8_9ACTN|nr:GyrI-like domain-containing protein [Bailinhaonella thermotolerans]RJL35308.1 hypothetical protein D5H75_00285 [Bailinhaonella thermotolerans]